MAEKASSIRWQTITREQFSTVSNLVLGLATGLVAFQSSLLVDRKIASGYALGFAVVSLASLAFSVIAALWCAVNRLKDFRKTAQIAREREGRDGELESERETVRSLGRCSWTLLWWQIGLFGLGAICGAIAVVCRVWS